MWSSCQGITCETLACMHPCIKKQLHSWTDVGIRSHASNMYAHTCCGLAVARQSLAASRVLVASVFRAVPCWQTSWDCLRGRKCLYAC